MTKKNEKCKILSNAPITLSHSYDKICVVISKMKNEDAEQCARPSSPSIINSATFLEKKK